MIRPMNTNETAPAKVRNKENNSMLLMPCWHPIANMPGYEACPATGQVRNARTGRTLRPVLSRSSCCFYARVRIHGRTRLVHRIVMTAQLGRPLQRAEQVRHGAGGPWDNRAANLTIGTAKQNSSDRLRSGTYGVKLRNQQVREIRHLAGRRSTRTLARQYGVTPSHVRRIITGRSWAGLPQ